MMEMHTRVFENAGWRTDDRIGSRTTDRCVRPGAHRRHAARGAPAHRPGGLRAPPDQARKRQSDRKHEGPHGACHDRGRRAKRTPETRRSRRRIHRRQHRRFARHRLRGARLFPQPRDVRRVQHRETPSHGGARRRADHRVPSTGGGMDASLTRNLIETARQIAGQTGALWTDQLNNTDQLSAYHALADEIWTQTGGRIDAFVQSAGTAACVRGVAEGLRRRKPDIRIVAVEPLESAVLSGGKSGVHKIEGVGAGFVVPLWNPSIANEIATVSTAAAIALGMRLGKAGTVVTLLCDSGLKYLSTPLYAGDPAIPPQ